MEPIEKRLDSLWSMGIRLMNPHCWFPGCGKRSTDACHIFPRRHTATRWLLENGLGGCRFHHNWEHANPKEAKRRITRKIGVERYDRLEMLANSSIKLMPSDLADLHSALKKEVEAYVDITSTPSLL